MIIGSTHLFEKLPRLMGSEKRFVPTGGTAYGTVYRSTPLPVAGEEGR